MISNVGNMSGWTVGFGLVSLALILALQAVAPQLPASLIAVVAGVLLARALDAQGHGVAELGKITAAMPEVSVPSISFADLERLFAGAIGLSLLAYAESIAAARTFAAKHHYEVDANQELVALGASNIGAGLLQGFTIDASVSRTATADNAGQRTQLAGLCNLVLVLITLALLTPFFADLPKATLAAVVIAAGAAPAEDRRPPPPPQDRQGRLLRRTRLPRRRPRRRSSGRHPCSDRRVSRRPRLPHLPAGGRRARTIARAGGGRGRRLPRRLQAPRPRERSRVSSSSGSTRKSFFANATFFRDQIRRLVESNSPPVHAILVDAEAITHIDSTAIDMLGDLDDELSSERVNLLFARTKGVRSEHPHPSRARPTFRLSELLLDTRSGVTAFLASDLSSAETDSA